MVSPKDPRHEQHEPSIRHERVHDARHLLGLLCNWPVSAIGVGHSIAAGLFAGLRAVDPPDPGAGQQALLPGAVGSRSGGYVGALGAGVAAERWRT